jgi:hypothetical protein
MYFHSVHPSKASPGGRVRFASVKSDGYDNSNSDTNSNYESDTSTEHARVKSTSHISKHAKHENDPSSGKLDSALRRELKRLGAIGPSAKPLKLSRAFQVRVCARIHVFCTYDGKHD